MDVSISFEPSQLRRASAQLASVGRPAAFIQATRRAVRRTATAVRTQIVKWLAGATKLPPTYIRQRYTSIRIEPEPAATIRITGRNVPIIALAARQTAQGVKYASQAGWRLLASAFVATMPRGHRGVFRRLTTRRLPIKEQFAPGPAILLNDRLPDIHRAATERLARELETQIHLLIRRAMP